MHASPYSTPGLLPTPSPPLRPAPLRRSSSMSTPGINSIRTLVRSGGPSGGSTLQQLPIPSPPPTRGPDRQPAIFPFPQPTRGPTRKPSMKPTPIPTRVPTRQTTVPTSSLATHPTRVVTGKPTIKPTFLRVNPNPPFSIVLASSSSMTLGNGVSSPSGQYRFGLSQNGDLQLISSINKVVIWRAVVNGAANCFMQSDGNLVMKSASKQVKWQTHTGSNPGAFLKLDDGGQVSIVFENSTLWLAGQPHRQYTGPPSASLEFPIRGAFYYPWYPETWTVNGMPVIHHPTLGKYSCGNSLTYLTHVKALEYAHVDLAIASWWGPDQQLDRARISNLLKSSLGKKLKWAVYHEKEYLVDQSVAEIRADLNYIKKWFAWHEAYGHIDGRPIVFVYNEAGCEVANRWNSASLGEWYVVLKLFPGHMDCPVQPDHWHQYGPASEVTYKAGYSFSISPGFWRADKSKPSLPRVNQQTWRSSVLRMVASQADWQLITTFNEWGEGTAVESAQEWASASGFGFYLDALHDIY